MRKLLLLFTLLAAVLLTSCDFDSDMNDSGYKFAYYTGTLSVISLSDQGSYTWENTRVSLTEERDGTLTFWMYDTRFVPQMPQMTMAVPQVSFANSATITSLLADDIVPYVNNKPFEQYLVTALSGTISGNQLNISFNCMGFRITFVGYEEGSQPVEPPLEYIYYKGTLSVIPLSGDGSYTWENMLFALVEENDKTLTLWMYDTRFVPQMPQMTMAVPKITYANSAAITSLLGDNIIPYMGGTPYEQYMVTSLSGTLSDNKQLNISFNCMGFRVTFIGTQING